MADPKAKDKGAVATAPADDKQKKPWLFKPGQSGNPAGRKKGSRNALGQAFIDALHEDFKAHGVAAITTVRETRPHEYLKVVASILPKELNVRTDALDEMTDDDLASILDAVRSALLAGAYAPPGNGEETPSRH